MLDHPGPGAGRDQRRHRGEVDRVGPVAAGADDVEQRGRRPGPARGRQHRGRPSPASSATVSPFARSSDGERRQLRRRGLPGHDLAHRPGRRVGVEGAAAEQGAEHRGPGPEARHRARPTGRPAHRGHGRAAAARPPRRRSTGSSGRAIVASASDQVASQRSSRRPSSTQTAGQSSISYFSCRLMPIPPVGWASPSRIATSTPRHRCGRRPPRRWRTRSSRCGRDRRPDADHSGPDLLAHRRVVAEDDHGGRRGRCGHGGSLEVISGAARRRGGARRSSSGRSNWDPGCTPRAARRRPHIPAGPWRPCGLRAGSCCRDGIQRPRLLRLL